LDRYLESFSNWYTSLSQEGYESHYLDWIRRDVWLAQKDAIKEAIQHKHYKAIYDISYGLPEVSTFISHDEYVKTAIDTRQEQFIRKIMPDIEIFLSESPLQVMQQKNGFDLVVALNVMKILDIEPERIASLWRRAAERDAIFTVLASDNGWAGLNDRAITENALWRLAEQKQFSPKKYFEFPDGVNWYLCHVTDDLEWLEGQEDRDKEVSTETGNAIFEDMMDRIEYIYTDIRGKHILDVARLLDYNIQKRTIHIDSGSLATRHDVVIALDVLSQIEQPRKFVNYIIGHTDADIYIFSGAISPSKYPRPIYNDGELSYIEYSRRFYSNLRLEVKRNFGYPVYTMEGLGKFAYSGNGEMFLVVEAGYRIPETIIRSMMLE